MRLVIIGVDNTVGVDGNFRNGLDLVGCGLPENFWALQWNEHGDEKGHIEYNSPMIQNQEITEVPNWANACVAVWQAKLDQEAVEAVEAEAARLAAQQGS
jgi:hypothetical protein